MDKTVKLYNQNILINEWATPDEFMHDMEIVNETVLSKSQRFEMKYPVDSIALAIEHDDNKVLTAFNAKWTCKLRRLYKDDVEITNRELPGYENNNLELENRGKNIYNIISEGTENGFEVYININLQATKSKDRFIFLKIFKINGSEADESTLVYKHNFSSWNELKTFAYDRKKFFSKLSEQYSLLPDKNGRITWTVKVTPEEKEYLAKMLKEYRAK